jgi:hypothetical protein
MDNSELFLTQGVQTISITGQQSSGQAALELRATPQLNLLVLALFSKNPDPPIF